MTPFIIIITLGLLLITLILKVQKDWVVELAGAAKSTWSFTFSKRGVKDLGDDLKIAGYKLLDGLSDIWEAIKIVGLQVLSFTSPLWIVPVGFLAATLGAYFED